MILVIDDDIFYTATVKRELEVLGYSVCIANSVDEAFDHLKTSGRKIDVAIIDLMMRPSDKMTALETSGGYETGAVLSALIKEAYPDIKRVCSSLKRYREELQSQFDYVLPKPLHHASELESLLKLIAKHKEDNIEISDAVKLAPSIFGMGVDLKDLVKWLRQKVT